MFKRVPFTPGDLTDHQWGTDDILNGVTNSTTITITNTLIGDAGGSMFEFSKGGNDTFFGGFFNVINTVYGDAVGNMLGHSKGGDDTFWGGGSLPGGGPGQSPANTFYGDAGDNMSDHSKGGNDTFGWRLCRQHLLR
jgi:hypothetical protein